MKEISKKWQNKKKSEVVKTLRQVMKGNAELEIENISLKNELRIINEIFDFHLDRNSILKHLNKENAYIKKEYDKLLNEFIKVREEAIYALKNGSEEEEIIYILKGGTSKNYKGYANGYKKNMK